MIDIIEINKLKDELLLILFDMDIPHSKTDVDDIDALRWLGRNMGIRNSINPKFDRAIEILKFLLKNDKSK